MYTCHKILVHVVSNNFLLQPFRGNFEKCADIYGKELGICSKHDERMVFKESARIFRKCKNFQVSARIFRKEHGFLRKRKDFQERARLLKKVHGF